MVELAFFFEPIVERKSSRRKELSAERHERAQSRRGGYRACLIAEPRERKDIEMPLSPSDGFEPRLGRSVSLDQAAQLLGVSRRTIYNRIRDGRLQTIRTLGGSQRVLLESVQDVRNPG